MKRIFLAVLIPVLCVAASAFPAASPDPNSAAANEIVEKYVQATQNTQSAQSASMEVDIKASIPSLRENGRLHALRMISRVGRITYHVLGFQGSNTVKTQVIARYLQAEQQKQSDSQMALIPANYKFKWKGAHRTDAGEDVYVFAVAPRKSRAGLFKGEVWLDAKTDLPVYERGRLVKNPSIFFKKVDFERAFAIQDHTSVPQYLNSTISTRIVGKVQLDINYSNYAQVADTENDERHAISTVSF